MVVSWSRHLDALRFASPPEPAIDSLDSSRRLSQSPARQPTSYGSLTVCCIYCETSDRAHMPFQPFWSRTSQPSPLPNFLTWSHKTNHSSGCEHRTKAGLNVLPGVMKLDRIAARERAWGPREGVLVGVFVRVVRVRVRDCAFVGESSIVSPSGVVVVCVWASALGKAVVVVFGGGGGVDSGR